MPLYSIFQIDHDDLDPSQIRAAANARMGAITAALDAGIHKHTADVEIDDLDDLTRLDPAVHQPLFFGDVVCDPSSCDTYVFTTCGLEVLSWDKAEHFIHRALEHQGVAITAPAEDRLEIA